MRCRGSPSLSMAMICEISCSGCEASRWPRELQRQYPQERWNTCSVAFWCTATMVRVLAHTGHSQHFEHRIP